MATEATVGLLRVVLTADTKQYAANLQGAKVQLGVFDREAKNAGRTLTRMVEGFSGQRLAADAAKVAEAVARIGGASRLTENELGKVRTQLDAAIEKFRVMGAQVPASIAKIRDEIAGIDADRAVSKLRTDIMAVDDAASRASAGGLSKFTGLLGMVQKVAPALGAVALATTLLSTGTAALRASDDIAKYADSAGVSTEVTQRWRYTAEQTSTTLEAFGNASYKLGVNVGNGTAQVRDAIDALGLSYAELRNLKPEDQFERVIERLEGVESVTERNRIGQALFGRQFSEIAGAVAGGYTQIMKEADVAGDAQVKAAQKAGDALDKLQSKVSTASINVFGGLAGYAFDTAAAMKLAFTGLDGFTEAQRAKIQEIRDTGFVTGMADLLDSFAKTRKDINLAGEAATDYVVRLQELRAEVAGLTTEQRRQIDAALQVSGITDELADQVGVSTEALRMYQEGARAGAERSKQLAEEKKKAAEAAIRFAASVRSASGALVPFAAAAEDSAAAIANVRAGFLADGSLVTATIQETAQAAGEAAKETEAWANATGARLAPALKDSRAQIAAVGLETDALAEKYQRVGRTITETLVRSFTGGGGWEGALKGLGAQGGGRLGEMLGEKLAAGIGGKLGAVLGGAGGPVGAAVGSLVGSVAGKLLGGLGGGQHRKVNDLRDAAFGAAGGFAELHKKLHAAGFSMERLLKAKDVATWEREWKAATEALNAHEAALAENTAAASTLFDEIMAAGSEGIPAAYRPAIEQLLELGLLTDEQAEKLRGLKDATGPSIDAMEKALGVFQGRVESLGPAFKQAKINETATEYVNAINTMIEGGGDLGGILFDAKEELGALVAEALRSGKTLPANLQPWIDDLVKSGNLVDENGKKITDVSGIKWGDPVKTEAQKAKEGWDRILAAIETLIEKITGPLEDGIERATRDRTVNVDVNYRERGTDGRNQGQPEGDRTGFALGTHGRLGSYFARFSPSGTMHALHGTQAVLNTRDALPFAIDALAGRIPEVPGLPGVSAGASETTNNTTSINILPVPVGPENAYELARAVIGRLPGALGINEQGLATAIESVIENYMRSYYRPA